MVPGMQYRYCPGSGCCGIENKYLSNGLPGNAVFPLPCLAVYHSKHPNPILYFGAGEQLGDWKVRTGVAGETSEHKGFLLPLVQFC